MTEETTTTITALDKPATFKTDSGEITLTVNMVKQFVAAGSKEITVPEAIRFIQLCRFNALNPFIGDAFLIKYGSDPATMVTSKYAYMKRGDRAGERYLGFKAGVVLLPSDWEEKLKASGKMPDPVLMEGAITYGLQLVGGWADVFVKGRENPVRSRVDFQEYVGKTREGATNRQWRNKPATMIRKVALVAALREAFPDVFGGLYSEEEFPEAPDRGPVVEGEIIDVETGEVTKKKEEKKPVTTTTEPPPIQRRTRRHEIEIDDKKLKTCGIDAAHMRAIKNSYERDPAMVKIVDNFLMERGIRDLTFLRKDEAAELVLKLSEFIPKDEEKETEESQIGLPLDETGEPGPEASKEEESSTTAPGEAPIESTPSTDRNEMIPCPDRGEMEIEFAFCQDQCPKYEQKTCIHFMETGGEEVTQ